MTPWWRTRTIETDIQAIGYMTMSLIEPWKFTWLETKRFDQLWQYDVPCTFVRD